MELEQFHRVSLSLNVGLLFISIAVNKHEFFVVVAKTKGIVSENK